MVEPVLVLQFMSDDGPGHLGDWLRRHGIAADLHVYAKGGHGFGMRRQPVRPVSDWPARTAEWMASMGFTAETGEQPHAPRKP